jgi:hypothetical protein
MFDQQVRSAVRSVARSLVPGLGYVGSDVLPRLADVHPGPAAGGRWIGLATVPVECIAGTTSTAMSRDVDFQPLHGRAPADWTSRWSRLKAAAQAQTVLPPVDLVRTGCDYWVVDGHNRVALAKVQGQLWIDAVITDLDLR